MNKKQYNNVIDWTLKHDQSAQTEDSLETARTIFKNMGVALPQGDLKQVSEVLKTDEYMGWRSCTMPEAQAAADKGCAAIGVSEEKIVILAANDEEQPVAETAAVMTLSDTAAASAESDLTFYSYSYGTIPSNPGGEGTVDYHKSWNELVFSNLDILHQLAIEYDSTNQMKLTLQFIRRGKYGDGNWNIVAGEINQDFVSFVENENANIYNFFTTESLIIYDHNNLPVDFIHLCATMNGIIVGGGTYWKSLAVGPTHVRNLAGWAGDVQTLVVDAYVLTNASNDYEEFYNTFYQMIGDESHSFGMKDLLADIDAFNFANNWISPYWQSNLFGTACKYYYSNTDIPGTGWTSRASLRYGQFIGTDTKTQFSNTTAYYTSQTWMFGIEWPIYETQAKERNITLNLTTNQSNAATNAFTDFIWEKYQAELSASNL